MNDEHIKLIAKIQHFYDFMIQLLKSCEEDYITLSDSPDKLQDKIKSSLLYSLSQEYSKAFENFLYKDSE